ncbi:hypothetical protein DFH06DRAFT_274985 [Mycena polygramma]|nr:hypothetical protein DFH06DRAFT_274985 [Mycena polygramma]
MSSLVPEDIDPSPPVLVPTHPFTSNPDADAILRSRDGADFYIVRAILSLVSPVFATMFRLPQPDPPLGIPVVDMEENAVTLDKVLRFIYPGTEPIVVSLDDLRCIIELVIAKYDMQCEVPKSKQYLERYCSSDYLGVYAVAFKYGWKDVAMAAAKESLKHPIRTVVGPAPQALEGMTAIAYHNLIHYHYLCGQAAQKTTVDLTWTPPPFNLGCKKPPCFPRASTVAPITFQNARYWVPGWFPLQINRIGRVLVEAPGFNIRGIEPYDVGLANGQCTRCHSVDKFRKWATVELPARLEAEIAKVRRGTVCAVV